jgi:hypothetical protein
VLDASESGIVLNPARPEANVQAAAGFARQTGRAARLRTIQVCSKDLPGRDRL